MSSHAADFDSTGFDERST